MRAAAKMQMPSGQDAFAVARTPFVGIARNGARGPHDTQAGHEPISRNPNDWRAE